MIDDLDLIENEILAADALKQNVRVTADKAKQQKILENSPSGFETLQWLIQQHREGSFDYVALVQKAKNFGFSEEDLPPGLETLQQPADQVVIASPLIATPELQQTEPARPIDSDTATISFAPDVESAPANSPPVHLAKINIANIPPQMKVRDQWVCHAKKEPFKPDGYPASLAKPETFSSFDAVCSTRGIVQGLSKNSKCEIGDSVNGIGFVFGGKDNGLPPDGLQALDLDHCFAIDGRLKPWAKEILDGFRTYTEITPSKCGLRVIYEGEPIAKGGKTKFSFKDDLSCSCGKCSAEKPPNIAIYDGSRNCYITVSGIIMDGEALKEITNCQDAANALFEKYSLAGYKVKKKPKTGKTKANQTQSKTKEEYVTKRWLIHLCRFLAELPPEHFKLDRDKITDYMLAIKCKFPDDFPFYFTVCQILPYERDEARARELWEGAKPSGEITVGTMWHDGAQLGWEPPGISDLSIARDVINLLGKENLVHAHGQFYKWSGKVWVEYDDLEVKQKIINAYEALGEGDEVTDSKASSVMKLSQTEIFIPGIQMPAERTGEHVDIIVNNGKLRFNNGTWELKDHVREDHQLSVIPVDYDPKAECPRFMRFFDEVFINDADKNDKKKFIQQMMGYSLTTNCKYEKAAVLIGVEGSNGKSVILFIVEHMLGEKNVAAVCPSQFGNKFQRAHLKGKLANVIYELKEGMQVDDQAFKAIVSGELSTAEQKFKDPFDFRPYAKQWLATNHLPHTRDVSFAFFRRPILIEFNRRFEDDPTIDVDLKRKLVSEELPGILNFALEGLKSLHDEGHFTEPASSKAAKAAWRQEADQVMQYVEERCIRSPHAVIEAGACYADYLEWAKKAGIRQPFTHINFGKRLRAIGVEGADGTNKIRLYKGVEIDYAKHASQHESDPWRDILRGWLGTHVKFTWNEVLSALGFQAKDLKKEHKIRLKQVLESAGFTFTLGSNTWEKLTVFAIFRNALAAESGRNDAECDLLAQKWAESF